jgi:AAA15 family ATPase/GTPase
MITEIRIANFYSIGEEQTISFAKNGKLPKKGYREIKQGENVSLINGFFGSNASGKTNILRSVVTLIALMYNVPVPNQIYDPNKGKYGVIRNFNSRFKDLPSKLGANFLFGDNLYSYDISFNDNGEIMHEVLQVKLNQASRFSEVYTRTYDGTVESGSQHGGIDKYLQLKNLELNQSFFGLCLIQGFPFVADFRDKIFMWNVANSDFNPSVAGVIGAAVNIKNNPIWIADQALQITIDSLRLFDPSIENIIIEIRESLVSIRVKHLGFDDLVDIMNESAGTRELFTYIYQIIQVLRKGGVVIYDEMNRLWHPDIQKAIFNLFLRESSENSNAQFLFTSHDHEVMNYLELDQIHLIEKEVNSTIIYKLSEVNEAKARDNIMKKYRLGLYGAIPDMIDFNYGLNELI